MRLGGGGTRLESQHSRDRGRGISEFEDNLIYMVGSRRARAAQESKESNVDQKSARHEVPFAMPLSQPPCLIRKPDFATLEAV